jgi:anti-sigma factor RsiW
MTMATCDENIFGKIRGRFDEDRARAISRTIPDRALAFCAAMTDAQMDEFAERFNQLFDRPVCSLRRAIVSKGKGE